MKNFIIKEPITDIEFKEYYKLRWITLRSEWGKPIGSEKDPKDKSSIHRMIMSRDRNALAVGRLHYISSIESQIRFMGVHHDYRRSGLGTLLLKELEQVSIYSKHNTIILQSREEAVPFYLSTGYKVKEKTYLLFGKIQHYLMVKNLY